MLDCTIENIQEDHNSGFPGEEFQIGSEQFPSPLDEFAYWLEIGVEEEEAMGILAELYEKNPSEYSLTPKDFVVLFNANYMDNLDREGKEYLEGVRERFIDKYLPSGSWPCHFMLFGDLGLKPEEIEMFNIGVSAETKLILSFPRESSQRYDILPKTDSNKDAFEDTAKYNDIQNAYSIMKRTCTFILSKDERKFLLSEKNLLEGAWGYEDLDELIDLAGKSK